MIILEPVDQPQKPPEPTQPKPPVAVPKNIFMLGVMGIAILAAVGGIVVLDKQRSPVGKRLVMPFVAQKPKPTATPIPTPTPIPDPTANWKTYANKSFTLRYPARFTVTEQQITSSYLYPTIYSSVTFSDETSTITITAARNTQEYTLNTLLGNGPLLRYNSTILADKRTRTLPVDGMSTLFVEKIAAGQLGASVDAVGIKDGKVYQFTLAPLNAESETFMLMLNTLKILGQEPSSVTDSWKIRIDPAYKFSFKYPGTHALSFNKVASGSPNLTTVYDDSTIQVDTPKFKIEVQDPKLLGQSAATSRAIMQLSLHDFANNKWTTNKTASDSGTIRVLGPLEQIAIDSKLAYRFTLSGKYSDDMGSEVLDEQYTFIFTENNGYKYKIWYPTSSTIYSQIFKTITFTK